MNAIASHPNSSGFAASFLIHAALLFILTFGFSSNRNPIGNLTLGDSVLIELANAPNVRSGVSKTRTFIAEEATLITEENGIAESTEAKKKKDEPQESSDEFRATLDSPHDTTSHATNEATSGARSGTLGTNGPLGDPNGIEVSERERYLYELRRFIDSRKTYPAISRQLGETGRVTLRVRIARDGSFSESKTLFSSAPKRLEASAHQLISSVAKFKTFPNALAERFLVVDIPIDYVLE